MRACCPSTRTSPPLAQRSPGLLVAVVIVLLLALAASLPSAGAAPAEPGRQDASARAAYLYNFLSYIEWPSRALPLTDSPLVIGVLNADAVAAELLLTTLGRNINNRPVTIRRLQPGDSLDDIHLLYIGPAEADTAQSIIQRVPQRWTVVVTDDAAAEPAGGAINFRESDGRLRFEISHAAVERGDFRLSSRLMALAIAQPGPN